MNVGTKALKQAKVNVRDAIEQDIVTGHHVPGDRLDEVKLATRYGVSRTPVREAINQLSAMGLVEIAPHRGAFVTRRNIGELVEMFEVASELEAMCVRLASRRIQPDQLEELEDAQAACIRAEEEGAPDDYYYANERFHQLIYEASGNSFLAGQAFALQRMLKPYRRLQLRVPGRIGRSRAEHGAVLEAIRNRDATAAQHAMRAHVVIQGESFGDFLAAIRRVDTALKTKT
ncbi:GntR family transcriptional regulator [Aquamicrobium sp. LC103]|uniref:GntR family transcriptional regulator n=1 Tax=Aquamicrobium sp. LC103 TaxID=1120658 RepID=UPI00063E6D78|nr:GntR family transcriptional regulator [Aquamicrobium sp. LC103]TKT76730.1 GntR family transcriptional regulator [Aquamicrobium sp. LC103]